MKNIKLYDNTDLTITEKYVYGVIQSYQNKYQSCTAARVTIGKWIDLSGNSVDLNRQKMVKKDVLYHRPYHGYKIEKLDSDYYTIVPLEWIKYFGGGRIGRVKAYICSVIARVTTWEKGRITEIWMSQLTGISRRYLSNYLTELRNDGKISGVISIFKLVDNYLIESSPYYTPEV